MPTTIDRVHELANDWALRRNVTPSEVICAAVHLDIAVLRRTSEENHIDPVKALADALQALAVCEEQEIAALFMEASEALAVDRQLSASEIRVLAKHVTKSHRLPAKRSGEVLLLAKMLYRLDDVRYKGSSSGFSFNEEMPSTIEDFLRMAAQITYSLFTAERVQDRTKLQTRIATLLGKIDRSKSRRSS